MTGWAFGVLRYEATRHVLLIATGIGFPCGSNLIQAMMDFCSPQPDRSALIAWISDCLE